MRGPRLDRAATSDADAIASATLPPALDPRRHPATLIAILLAATVAGGLVPLVVVDPSVSVRAWARWRVLRRAG